MRKFTETELRELLDGCLNMSYNVKLINLDWDVQEHPYKESIAKLESVEPEIIQLFQQQKCLDALEAKTGTKGNNNNNCKRGDDNNTGCKDSKKQPRKPGTPTTKPHGSNGKKPWNNHFQKKMVNLIIEVTKQDNSNSDESLTGWKKNTTKAK